MISDVLADAVAKVDRYLSEMPDVYEDELRARVVAVQGSDGRTQS